MRIEVLPVDCYPRNTTLILLLICAKDDYDFFSCIYLKISKYQINIQSHPYKGSILTLILGGKINESSLSLLARTKIIISCPGSTRIMKFLSCFCGYITCKLLRLNYLRILIYTLNRKWRQKICYYWSNYVRQHIQNLPIETICDEKLSFSLNFPQFFCHIEYHH